MQPELKVIGGGLAGCEAAWQAAERNIHVQLFEMRPQKMTGAHQTAWLGELVCSNSLGSKLRENGSGLLFHEMKELHSIICRVAEQSAVPAGSALAVDRHIFAETLTELIATHPNIEIIREEITTIPKAPTIIASGPLTSPALAISLANFHGKENLFFYDAIAPIITADSINMSIAVRGSRHGKGEANEGDYINCPMDQATYNHFVQQLAAAEQIHLKSFERKIEYGVDVGHAKFFEGCLPIEVMARRDPATLAYGPLRPVGLRKLFKGDAPFAIVQLRQDDLTHHSYNMVGFQTNLTYKEQKRVFKLIPGLEQAEFMRYGQMHRNTFLCAPSLINQTLQTKKDPSLFFAGQIIGVEGYLGNAASGLIAGINASRQLKGSSLLAFPRECMIGALCFYIANAGCETFQPMKANLGLLAPLQFRIRDKQERKAAMANRALRAFRNYAKMNNAYN